MLRKGQKEVFTWNHPMQPMRWKRRRDCLLTSVSVRSNIPIQRTLTRSRSQKRHVHAVVGAASNRSKTISPPLPSHCQTGAGKIPGLSGTRTG